MNLHEEILEQPSVISRLLTSSKNKVLETAKTIGLPKGIFIAARGTSDNAARYAKYIWGALNRLPVALAAPSLFSKYQRPPNLDDLLVIAISQSGESPDLLAVLEEAIRQGSQTLAITNQPDSPLGKIAELVLDIQARPERSIAATKTYTAQLAMIAMLAAAWQQDSYLWDELDHAPHYMSEVLQQESQIKDYSTRYRYMDQCVVLGRGYNYATAYEWSLKLKELSYIVAQPYSSADFMHGPIALVSSGFPVFAIAPSGKVLKDMAGLLKKLIDVNQADLFLLTDQPDLLKIAACPVPLPSKMPEWISPLVSIIPAQLFSYHLTLVKGIDPDSPRSLSKVTLTK